MKVKIFSYLVFSLMIIACSNKDNEVPELKPVKTETLEEFVWSPLDHKEFADTVNVGKLAFAQETIDFDTIREGQRIEKVYTFRNTGNEPITIRDVRSSCGCTIPSWPENAVQPGESGEIKVSFNSEGRPGYQDKPIVVRSDALPPKMELRLKGYVKPKNR